MNQKPSFAKDSITIKPIVIGMENVELKDGSVDSIHQLALEFVG
ncbi:MAG: hypothetical protein AAGC64_09490 [Bacteroidota bacterium]